MTLNSVCDHHGHDPGLPEPDMRAHVLAAATRTAEQLLRAHGYTDPERAIEVLHVALEDALDLGNRTPSLPPYPGRSR